MHNQQNTILTLKKEKSFNVDLLLSNSRFIFSLLIILTGTCFVCIYPKGYLLIQLNNNYNLFFDYFFKYLTYYGDAILYLPIVVAVFFTQKRKVLPLIYLLVTQTFFTHLFKKIIFTGMPRPKVFFSEDTFALLHKVEGLKIHSFYNSFPSGHTITAFSLTFFFIFIYKLPLKIQWFLLFLAWLAAISRVYLLQHFFMDIIFGAFLGILSAFLVAKCYKKIKIPKLR